MSALFIPNETDFKRWVREAVRECIQDSSFEIKRDENTDEPLLGRKEIASFLRISLVTLTDWKKRGLPSHKQRGKVYFMKSEVLDYIKINKPDRVKFSSKFQHLRV